MTVQYDLLAQAQCAILNAVVAGEADQITIPSKMISNAVLASLIGEVEKRSDLGDDLTNTGPIIQAVGTQRVTALIDRWTGLDWMPLTRAELVVADAWRRGQVKIAARRAEQAVDAGESPAEAIDVFNLVASDVLENDESKRGSRRLFDIFRVEVDTLIEGEDKGAVIQTGLSQIDAATRGVRRGTVVTVAGRPGAGKSCFLLNAGVNAALRGEQVLFIDLEDTAETQLRRIVSRLSDVDYQTLQDQGQLSRNDAARVTLAAQTIEKLSFEICDEPLTAIRIGQLAKHRKNKTGLDLLVIDHIGEILPPGYLKGHTLFEQVSANARAVRNLAKRLNVGVLLGSQLNRNVEARADKRPKLHDLRQSGEIEQISRQVWILYRPGYYTPDADQNELEINVAKSNQGITGRHTVFCDLSRMYIGGREAMR